MVNVNVNVRNLPDEVHRAIRVQAAQHSHSTEAEIRDILERATRPEGHVKLGSFLASIAREAGGLTDEERALFESERVKSSPVRRASNDPARYDRDPGAAAPSV